MIKIKGYFTAVLDKLEESEHWIKMKPSSRILYIHLLKLERWYKTEWFFHSEEDLAKEINISLNTIRRSKKELKENGFIDIKREYFHFNKRCYDCFKILHQHPK